jgi:hypothetical protein
MKVIIALVGVTLLASCASGNPVRVEGIEVADSASVANCKYLDSVYGTSSWYGVFAEKGIENARLSAFEKAKDLGGTDMVWESTPQGYGSSQVAAKVYRCN